MRCGHLGTLDALCDTNPSDDVLQVLRVYSCRVVLSPPSASVVHVFEDATSIPGSDVERDSRTYVAFGRGVLSATDNPNLACLRSSAQ